ncbi:MAG: methyltransferase domain-containing protein [Pirellulales bacterium]|nr:methyltransferase domain-containing protein [Pirellulales bacterium]
MRRRFDVVEHQIAIGGRRFELRHPRSADDLIDEGDFARDERLPYWAEIWPSAYVLAERISEENGRGRRMLELGCGSGLSAMAALASGFEVTAVDYYSDALQFVRLNVMLNELPPATVRSVDWRAFPIELHDFDVVVAADVLYERDYCRLIAAAFKQSLRAGGMGLLTDPQRVKAESFPDECRRAGLSVGEPNVFGPLSVPGGDTFVKQTVNLFEMRQV